MTVTTVNAINRTFSMPVGEELTSLVNFCKVMADSPYYKKLGPGGVMSIVLTAKELNLPLMPCLNGGLIYINGLVTLSAQLMQALLIFNGHEIELVELNEKRCHLRFKRKDKEKADEYVYSVEDAEKSKYLGKDNWKFHLKDMLYCRCLSGGARKFMPDALLGCYVQGEMNSEETVLHENILAPLHQEKEEIKEIEKIKDPEQKYADYKEFCRRHHLNENSLKDKYIEEISSASEMSIKKIISLARENEDLFCQKFLKWTEDQNREED